MKITLLLLAFIAYTQAHPMHPDMFLKKSLMVVPMKITPKSGVGECNPECRYRCAQGTGRPDCDCAACGTTIDPPTFLRGEPSCAERCAAGTEEPDCSCETTRDPPIPPPDRHSNNPPSASKVALGNEPTCTQRCAEGTGKPDCDCSEGTTRDPPIPPMIPGGFQNVPDFYEPTCKERCAAGIGKPDCDCNEEGTTIDPVDPPIRAYTVKPLMKKLDPFSPTCIQRCAAGMGEPICDCGQNGPNEQSIKFEVENTHKKAILPALVFKRQRVPPFVPHYP